MKNKTSKIIILAVLVNFIIILTASPAYAHKMIIEPVEPGVIKVIYEDGRFSTRTVVEVYDKDNKELLSGKLDENGYFAYNEIDAVLIIADDGLGHRAEWIVGEETGKTGQKKGITIGVVLAGFGAIAMFSKYRLSRRNQEIKK